jgi:hypothetical protein
MTNHQENIFVLNVQFQEVYEYYKQNHNTTLKSKEAIPLTAKAYKGLLRRQRQQSKNRQKKKPRIDDNDDDDDDDNDNSVDNKNKNNKIKIKIKKQTNQKEVSSSPLSYLNYMANKTNKIKAKACYLRLHPDCPLFVARNGVIVMAYDGFPPSLIQVKEKLEESLEESTYHPNPNPNPNPNPKLKKENFGSKWPKTTLAAVFDNASELTCEELIRLKQLCYYYGQQFHTNNNNSSNNNNNNKSDNNNDNDIIRINKLSFVNYECRSLEKLNSRIDISLKNNGFDFTNPSNKEREIVNSVINEWSSSDDSSNSNNNNNNNNSNNEVGIAEEYLSKVNQPGSRMNTYRQSIKAIIEESKTANDSGSMNMNNINGVTCVTFINDNDNDSHQHGGNFPDRYRQILIDFRIAVDIEFPGRYAWFAEKSLHCTIRSLDTTDNTADTTA